MMRFLLALTLSLFVAACSTDQSTGTNTGGSSGSDNTNSTANRGPAPGTQAHLNQTIGDRVFFDLDRYNVRADMSNTVRAWAQWLQQNPNVSVLVEGHCDERGTRDYNLALGARRSHQVKEALQSLGVNPARIETTTFGKERPAVLGSNEGAWAKNRRAVMVVKGAGTS